MKIYYDKESSNVLIEGDDRLLPSGSLLAEEFNGNIAIKYKGTETNNLYIDYVSVQKENGSQAGSSNQEVIDYLNAEFNKGVNKGSDGFTLLQNEVTINNVNIYEGDIVTIVPVSLTINEIVFVKNVFNGGFTVGRVIINAIGSLTNNLPFNWVKY